MTNSKNETGLFAPSYYKEFHCISDRCRHSCCVDWEICIDNDTYKKYMDMNDISPTVTNDGDCACFALREDGRCPHLGDNGLCRIIISYGEEFLSEICREHPRFYNRISSGRTEAGLGIVCEEACRLILESETPFSLFKTENATPMADNSNTDFDAITPRDRIISLIEGAGKFEQKLATLKSEFKLPELHTAGNRLDRLLALEILDEAWENDLNAMHGRLAKQGCKPSSKFGSFYERLLVYFVYRHVSVAQSEQNLRARLAFCIFSVETISLLFEGSINAPIPLDTKKAPESLIDWARRYSAEIEYSEDNTDELIFMFESKLLRV